MHYKLSTDNGSDITITITIVIIVVVHTVTINVFALVSVEFAWRTRAFALALTLTFARAVDNMWAQPLFSLSRSPRSNQFVCINFSLIASKKDAISRVYIHSFIVI